MISLHYLFIHMVVGEWPMVKLIVYYDVFELRANVLMDLSRCLVVHYVVLPSQSHLDRDTDLT